MMRGVVKGALDARGSQSEAFPSWRSAGGDGRAAQSVAALVACAARPSADVARVDGKAGGVGEMLVGGGRYV